VKLFCFEIDVIKALLASPFIHVHHLCPLLIYEYTFLFRSCSSGHYMGGRLTTGFQIRQIISSMNMNMSMSMSMSMSMNMNMECNAVWFL
jgi:hypothetical protein